MTDTLTFYVPGRPVPTARPRVLRSGRTYTPTRSTDAQRLVGEAALAAGGGKRPLFPVEPLSVAISAVFPYAKGTAKKRIEPGWVFMGVRPDADNLCKTVLDGCNGVVWADDAQVVELVVRKFRSGAGDEGFYVEISEV